MKKKLSEKEKAIILRKQGLSYREILKQIPVAKSTLSLWLRNVGLTNRQTQRLTKNKLAAAKRGGEAKHRQKVERVQIITEKAKAEVNKISKRELWLIGVMLYWAEGTKEKEWRAGQNIQFANSDSKMIGLFLKWLSEICEIKEERITFGIYIHENSKNNINDVRKYWSQQTQFPLQRFNYVHFKSHNPKTNRKNTTNSYYGVLKITVKASSDLNRKVTGWTQGIYNHCGFV